MIPLKMMCNIISIVNFYVILMTAADSSSSSKTVPTHEQVIKIASLIERNVQRVMNFNRDVQLPCYEEFDLFWTNIFKAFRNDLQKDIDMKRFSDIILNRLAMNIVRKKFDRYGDILKVISKIADNCYGRSFLTYYYFYDEVIDRLNNVQREEPIPYCLYELDMAVERHMFGNFLVFLGEKCRVDNSLVQTFTQYPHLLNRNIERYIHNKNVTFVFKSIVNKFVTENEVVTENKVVAENKVVGDNEAVGDNDKIVILQGFVERIYEECVKLNAEHNVVIGFNKGFVSEYEKTIDSLQTPDVKELTVKSLIANKTFTKKFPPKFFDQIPDNLEQYTDLKLFVKELSKMKMKEYFEEFRNYANEDQQWGKPYIGDADKYSVNIKAEPLLMYKLQDIRKETAEKFIECHQEWKYVIHRLVSNQISDYDMDNIRHFIGMEYESLKSDLCPISSSVMTRAVGFKEGGKHYDLTSIMLYWIRSVSDRAIITYEIFELSSKEVVDIRNFKIIEGRSQSILTFFKRAGSFSNHIEDYKFYDSLNANQTLFVEIISTILTKFPSISQDHRKRIMIKVKEFEGRHSDQNVHVVYRDNEEAGRLETDMPNSNYTHQDQNPECDAIKYKDSKIISLPKLPLQEAEKNADTVNKYVDKVREDLQDYRSRL